MSRSDVELWAEVREGGQAAFGQLFDRYARAVYNYCFRRTADWSLAEDCTSVVFLDAWRRRHRVQLAGDSLLPWLLGVANNVLRNRSRSLRRHRAALARMPPPMSQPDFAEELAGRLDDERRMRAVLGLVGRLSAADQEVVALCVWAGLTYEQAAASLNVPVGTVRSRLSRARERLRRLESELVPPSGQRWASADEALRPSSGGDR